MMTKIEPNYTDDAVTLYAGDCLDILPTLPDNSVDAVVTDPPYGLEFMGKDWDKFGRGKQPDVSSTGYTDGFTRLDRPAFTAAGNPHCRKCGKGKYDRTRQGCECAQPDFGNPAAAQMRAFQAWCQLWAAECLRVLKPGGHLLAFGGTRTSHRLTCGIEDAGFEIRDNILAWLYGSGFPKSLDVSKAIDRAAGAEREVTGTRRSPFTITGDNTYTREGQGAHGFRPPVGEPSVFQRNTDADGYKVIKETAPATADAQRWQGWGTALKPAHEPIVVARKPLVGTVAANVLAHGTGALNIDGCRIEASDKAKFPVGYSRGMGEATYSQDDYTRAMGRTEDANPSGRWPANVALDETAAAALDHMSGELTGRLGMTQQASSRGLYEGGTSAGDTLTQGGRADIGGASRFFKVVASDPPVCVLHGMLSVCESAIGAAAKPPTIDTAHADAQGSPQPPNEDNEDSSPGPVSTAGSSSPATDALVDAIARLNVPAKSAASLVRSAASAVNLCGSCVTAIVQSAVLTRQGHPGLSPLGLASTHNNSAAILSRSLALVAKTLAKCDTTSTTTDLTTSLGCAVDAISTYITQASRHGSNGSDLLGPAIQPGMFYTAKADSGERITHDGISHPTVKPLSLMRWLVRLVTPPGGLILEPFAGSGTTVEAAILEGFRCIAVEREADYLPLITQRINRRRDPLAYLAAAGEDLGLFDLDEELA